MVLNTSQNADSIKNTATQDATSIRAITIMKSVKTDHADITMMNVLADTAMMMTTTGVPADIMMMMSTTAAGHSTAETTMKTVKTAITDTVAAPDTTMMKMMMNAVEDSITVTSAIIAMNTKGNVTKTAKADTTIAAADQDVTAKTLETALSVSAAHANTSMMIHQMPKS
jgi:hypothetical protein